MASDISAMAGDNPTADTSPGDMLDCLITDLHLGKEAAKLRAPRPCSISMTTLSKESLVPTQVTLGRRRCEEKDYSISVHSTSHFNPASEYSSSIYSKRSSALVETESGQTTMSFFPTDEILTPRPLDFFREASPSAIDCQGAIAKAMSTAEEDKHSSTVGTLQDPQRPRSTAQSHTSSDNDTEALMKEIVTYPMVHTSPTHRLTQTPSQPGHIVVNQKAARLLGLDGAGYVCQLYGRANSY